MIVKINVSTYKKEVLSILRTTQSTAKTCSVQELSYAAFIHDRESDFWERIGAAISIKFFTIAIKIKKM